MSCRSALESPETPVVARVLRSGVKLVQQPDKKNAGRKKTGKKEADKKETGRKKADKKKLSISDPVSGGGKVKTRHSLSTPRDSPSVLGVSFTRHQAPVARLSVDRNSWVLLNMEDVARAETEFKVRVTGKLIQDLPSTSSQPRYHLIRLAGASPSSYQQDSQGRHSVIFPINSSATTVRKIHFTRVSSDIGKEVEVVFSLENRQGELVSKRVYNVKIRDEKTPEIPIIEL